MGNQGACLWAGLDGDASTTSTAVAGSVGVSRTSIQRSGWFMWAVTVTNLVVAVMAALQGHWVQTALAAAAVVCWASLHPNRRPEAPALAEFALLRSDDDLRVERSYFESWSPPPATSTAPTPTAKLA